MQCTNHSQTPAVAVCATCKKPLCETCVIHWQDTVTCKHCLETSKMAAANTRETLRKSPVLAGFLSLLPGLGQAYVGYYKRGFAIILIVAAIITFLESNVGAEPMFGLFLTFLWIFNVIDAVNKARLYNLFLAGSEVIEPPSDSPLAGGIILLVIGAILTLSITFDMDLEFLENLWPLALLGAGIYMLWKYARVRGQMEQKRHEQETTASSPPRDPHTP